MIPIVVLELSHAHSSYVAVLSFLGAFLLIRHKLKEATREEMIAEGIKLVNSPLEGSSIKDVERDAKSTMHNPVINGTARSALAQNKQGSYSMEPPVVSAHPRVEQVGLFRSNVSSHLLGRTHALCVFLAAAGFILAIVGIICYAWAFQPVAVSVFASTCLGVSLLAMIILLI